MSQLKQRLSYSEVKENQCHAPKIFARLVQVSYVPQVDNKVLTYTV